MASLRTSPQSPFWIACFTAPNGQRTNRSTKTSDRGIAQRIADEWQATASKAREGQFVQTQARSVLNSILAHVGQDPLSNESVDSFFRRWIAGKGEGSTARRYSSTVERFLAHLRERKTSPLTTISYQDIIGFIDSRQEEGLASATVRVDLRTLCAAFNVARKLSLINSNPVEQALVMRPLVVTSSQRDCFTPDQVSALLSAAEGDWKMAILLGYYTGARLGDCAKMRWDNVNFSAGVIDFVPQKTRRKNKRVVVPIHPQLLSHLQSLGSQDQGNNFLCPSLAGKSNCGNNGLSRQFNRITAKAGIDAQMVPGLGIRQFSRLSFHSLRHSFNSALANAGIDQETRMKLTGHASVSINADYTHLDLRRLRSAVEKLPPVV